MLGIFLDSETNGLNVRKHRMIELAYKILNVETGETLESYETLLQIPYEEWKKSDPLSLEVNGFAWHDLKDGKTPSQVAEEVKLSFKRCGIKRGEAVFICQNPSFDRAFFSQIIDADAQEKLNWPYHWLDLASMYWGKCLSEGTVNPWETGISKNKIAAALGLPPEADPHKAMNGVNHLILCYEAVIGFPLKVTK
ncbi:MAG: 3'-5' exonuclease [Chlamydiales bacterium]|nr:3'-5' exonuclease [Chlamydiales bacterium]